MKQHFRVFFAGLLLAGASFSVKAQISVAQADTVSRDERPIFLEQPAPAWRERLHYGGNVWFNFWNGFFIDLSPMVGYSLNNHGTIAGVGATLNYQGRLREGGQLAVGPRFFVRQAIWRSIFAHAEYELVNAPANRFYSYTGTNTTGAAIGRKWGGSPLIGAGFYQGSGGQQRGSFISLLYNLGYPRSGYISPFSAFGTNTPFVLRIGFFI